LEFINPANTIISDILSDIYSSSLAVAMAQLRKPPREEDAMYRDVWLNKNSDCIVHSIGSIFRRWRVPFL
jgi:hypothetical protein